MEVCTDGEVAVGRVLVEKEVLDIKNGQYKCFRGGVAYAAHDFGDAEKDAFFHVNKSLVQGCVFGATILAVFIGIDPENCQRYAAGGICDLKQPGKFTGLSVGLVLVFIDFDDDLEICKVETKIDTRSCALCSRVWVTFVVYGGWKLCFIFKKCLDREFGACFVNMHPAGLAECA